MTIDLKQFQDQTQEPLKGNHAPRKSFGCCSVLLGKVNTQEMLRTQGFGRLGLVQLCRADPSMSAAGGRRLFSTDGAWSSLVLSLLYPAGLRRHGDEVGKVVAFLNKEGSKC